MRYMLMHKQIAVADVEIERTTGRIQAVHTIHAPEHLPIGILMKKRTLDWAALQEWWLDRTIPITRPGVQESLEQWKLPGTSVLPLYSYGLSLSDQYWICPAEDAQNWDDINFFEHDFSNDVGDCLFGEKGVVFAPDFSSPDNTSDGNLRKRWLAMDHKRYLIKGGSDPFRQEPFNEVIASEVMDRLTIPHVPYTLVWQKGAPYSMCQDFVTKETELVPAWRILKTEKKPNNQSVYQHFLTCCEHLGIEGAVPFLDRMLTLDWVIANEDRHFNNFGVLRNADTLDWIGFAPIYDSGSSLGYNKMKARIHSKTDLVCKPFRNTHAKQLELVSDFGWADFECLEDIGAFAERTLSEGASQGWVGEERISEIVSAMERRIHDLSEQKAADTVSVQELLDGLQKAETLMDEQIGKE